MVSGRYAGAQAGPGADHRRGVWRGRSMRAGACTRARTMHRTRTRDSDVHVRRETAGDRAAAAALRDDRCPWQSSLPPRRHSVRAACAASLQDRVDRRRPTPTSTADGAGDGHADRSSAPEQATGRAADQAAIRRDAADATTGELPALPSCCLPCPCAAVPCVGQIGADRHQPARPAEQETATPTGAVRRSRLPAEPSERRSTWQATQEGIAVSRGWAAGG